MPRATHVIAPIVLVVLGTATRARAGSTEVGPADDVESAINALKPGDELVLRGGTYTFTSRFGVSVKGTAAQPVVVRAKPGEHPLFFRADASQNLVDFDDVEYLTLRGVELKGGSHGLRLTKARFVTVEDCEIHHTGDVGLSANSTGPYEGLHIVHNDIHDTGGTGEGMYLGCNSNACRIFDSVVERNHVHDTKGPNVSQGDGIEIKEGSYGNVVRDNVVHDTGYPCIITYSVVGNGGPNVIERNVMWGCGDHAIQSAADATIRNNIILSSKADGIAMQPHQSGTPANLVVVHNTILEAQNDAIKASGITGSVVIANNAVYAQSGSAISVSGSLGAVVVAGNVGVGALTGVGAGLATGSLANDFVAASYAGAPPNDVFPKAGSALLGTGAAAHVVADDFEGRPRNGVADVGAYAFAAGPPSWPIGAGFKTIAGAATPDGGAGSSGGDGGDGGASSGGPGGSSGSSGDGGGGGGGPPGAGGGADDSGCAIGRSNAFGAVAFVPLGAVFLFLARRRSRSHWTVRRRPR